MDEPDEGDLVVQRLNLLFETVHPEGRGPYTNEEIAERAAARGHEISAINVRQIRRGRRSNPTVRTLRALAAAFEVPVRFFFTDDTPETARAAQSGESPPAAAREIMFRSARLSPEGMNAVSDLIRNLESLPGATKDSQGT